MKFYSFEEIRAVGDCAAFARDALHATVSGGRCAAVWRGGDNAEAVSIKKDEWYDHVEKRGGGIIELAAHQFGGDKQQAQQFLGEYYNLTPKCETGKAPMQNARYDGLIRDGYKEVKRYEYRDLDGNLVHFVARLEHPEKPKEFCQGTPDGWNMNNVEPILYNLKAVTEAPWAIIVEGEKKCDMLIALGLPATTCCGGARKWHSGYAATFVGKSVAVLPDNDEPGLEHAKIVAATLRGVATEVRIVITSHEPKGDVADWLEESAKLSDSEKVQALQKLISETEPVSTDALAEVDIPQPDSAEVKSAKSANILPFRNFIPIKHQPDPNDRRRKQGSDIEKRPRLINELIDDLHRRFLGFPCKVGEEMFDHDRDTGRICFFWKASELFAWIARKSKNRMEWESGSGFITKEEMFAGIHAAATRYEAISYVPDWPKRDDVYYAHEPLPAPDKDRRRFRDLIRRFVPATEADLTFLKAFFCAPLWYRPGVPKPAWVIDSEDGAGTGKSTIVEMAALLYRGEPIRTNRQELRMGIQELIKRLVSASGRQQRILLIDNVTGQFSCPELADLITANSVSGRAPYGHGEETRPNNLVYVLTANTATVDNDIADRSYYINVKRPTFSATWKEGIQSFIKDHRGEILADIIALVQEEHFHAEPQTRFPEFETTILQAVCETPEEYNVAIAHLKACRASSNVEEEQAKAIDEAIREGLIAAGLHPEEQAAFITSAVMELWLKDVVDRSETSGTVQQHVRNLSKQNLLTMIDPKIRRWPHNGSDRRSGFMWNHGASKNPKTLTLRGKKEVEVKL